MIAEKEINMLVDILSKSELNEEENKLYSKLLLLQRRILLVNDLKGIDADLDELDKPIEK